MKVLRVISSVNPHGGGPIEGIKQLHAPLHLLGTDIEILCCDAPDSPWLATSGLPIVHALGPAHGVYSYTPNLLPWLRTNAHRFDAVIVEGIWQYHGLAVRQALAGTKTPYFVFTHGMLGPWFKRAYPLKHLKKWLYWPWAEYRILRDARAVLFTCDEERRLARESFWLYRATEAVTGFGTNTPPLYSADMAREFSATYPHLQGKRIILFLGRIHKVKGCDLLINAFAELAKKDESLHLIMAGPDPTDWGDSLKSLADRLCITSRVTWLGTINGDAKWGAFYAAEVFCLPSHHENFGVVVAEALACGKPVLISNKVNIWREIEADAAGFVDEDTIDGTIRNLQRWLALDVNSYTEMSNRARQCFAKRFHISRAAERLVEIIRDGGDDYSR